MATTFRVGDHVSWNSEAGRVSGTIIAIHTTDFDDKGHVHHASEDRSLGAYAAAAFESDGLRR